MTDSLPAWSVHLRLAADAHRRRLDVARDRLLVLAIHDCWLAGWRNLGEQLRQVVSRQSPNHRIARLSLAEALEGDGAGEWLKRIERQLPLERAEAALEQLHLEDHFPRLCTPLPSDAEADVQIWAAQQFGVA